MNKKRRLHEFYTAAQELKNLEEHGNLGILKLLSKERRGEIFRRLTKEYTDPETGPGTMTEVKAQNAARPPDSRSTTALPPAPSNERSRMIAGAKQ